MPETAPERAPLILLAAQLSQSATLDRIALLSANIHRGTKVPQSENYELRSDFLFKVQHFTGETPKELQVHVNLIVIGFFEEKNAKAELFKIESQFALDYHFVVEGDLDPIAVDAFSKMNGVYNAWPYWREWVQSVTCRMNVPPLTLPLITGSRIERIFAKEANEQKAVGALRSNRVVGHKKGLGKKMPPQKPKG